MWRWPGALPCMSSAAWVVTFWTPFAGIEIEVADGQLVLIGSKAKPNLRHAAREVVLGGIMLQLVRASRPAPPPLAAPALL